MKPPNLQGLSLNLQCFKTLCLTCFIAFCYLFRGLILQNSGISRQTAKVGRANLMMRPLKRQEKSMKQVVHNVNILNRVVSDKEEPNL